MGYPTFLAVEKMWTAKASMVGRRVWGVCRFRGLVAGISEGSLYCQMVYALFICCSVRY